MSYARDREDFIAQMTREGLPLHIARLLLREATGLNRRAELACSSEQADRDRVPCPATKGKGRPCLCDDYPIGTHEAGKHNRVTRISVQDWHAEERIRKALEQETETCAHCFAVGSHDESEADNCTRCARPWKSHVWSFTTAGDPRGYVLRVIPPSYAERNQGRDRYNQDAIGVPNGPSGLRF